MYPSPLTQKYPLSHSPYLYPHPLAASQPIIGQRAINMMDNARRGSKKPSFLLRADVTPEKKMALRRKSQTDISWNRTNSLQSENNSAFKKQTSQLPQDQESLIALEAQYDNEIKKLKARKEELRHRNTHHSSGGFPLSGSSNPAFRELEDQIRDLTETNNLLSAEKEELWSKVRIAEENISNSEHHYTTMFSDLEKKNVEVFKQQLGFKYANNDKDTIDFLKHCIMKLELGQRIS